MGDGMDAAQYFQTRGDLVVRVLLDDPISVHRKRSVIRLIVTGFAATMPSALICWASKALLDPGYFARLSTLMVLLSIAVIILIAYLETTDVMLRRSTVASRHRLIERTLSQLLKIDASLAHRVLMH